MASDAGNTLFDYLKMKFRVDTGCKLICPLPLNIWKDYKKQWVVLSIHISPPECYLTYCSQEEDWLMNQPTLPKITLDNFKVNRCVSGSQGNGMSSLRGIGGGGGTRNILEVNFDHYSIFFEYESMSKLQSWYDQLEKIKNRTFTELVRCPEHPSREREYVLQVTTDKILFYSPRLLPSSPLMTEFEWRLDNIRRAKFHKSVGKVEVEVGRAAETGEGHFYFIGPQVKNFFNSLKERIEELSKAASLKDRGRDLPLRLHPLNEDSTVVCDRAESPVSSESGSGGDGVQRFFIKPPPPPPYHPSTLSPPPTRSLPSLSPPPPLPHKSKIYETMKPAERGGVERKESMVFKFRIDDSDASKNDFYQPLELSTRVKRSDYDFIGRSNISSDVDRTSSSMSFNSEETSHWSNSTD